MATPFCTSSLRRPDIAQFLDKYIITGNGAFLELFDLEAFSGEDFDPKENEPIRTRVFEDETVARLFPQFVDDHVLVLYNTFNKDSLRIGSIIVHDETILQGGCANLSSVYTLFQLNSLASSCVIKRIPGKTEILVLTDSCLIHYKYVFDENDIFSIEVIEKIEYRAFLRTSTQVLTKVLPLDIDTNMPYSFLIRSTDDIGLSPYRSIFLLNQEGKKWNYRELKDTKKVGFAYILTGLDLAVLKAPNCTQVVSTKAVQPGVSRNQLRLIFTNDDEDFMDTAIRVKKDKAEYLLLLGNRDIYVWGVERGKIEMRQDRNFCHNNTTMGKNYFADREYHASDTFNAAKRIEKRRLLPDLVHEFPTAATVVDFPKDSSRQSLVIAYESGAIKVIEMAEIIRKPISDSLLLPTAVELCPAYPVWNVHLASGLPFSLIGNASGFAVVLKKVEPGRDNAIAFARCEFSKQSVFVEEGKLRTMTVFWSKKSLCICMDGDPDRIITLKFGIDSVVTSGRYIGINLLSAKVVVLKVPDNLDANDLRGIAFRKLRNERISAMLVDDRKDEIKVLVGGVFGKFAHFNYKLKEAKRLQELLESETTNELITISHQATVIAFSGDSALSVSINPFGGYTFLFESGLVDVSDDLKDVFPRTLFADTFPENTEIVGMITVESITFHELQEPANIHERQDFVLAKYGDCIYMKDPYTEAEPCCTVVPKNFCTSSIFAHFMMPRKLCHCAVYSMPQDNKMLIRVVVRLECAWHKEVLQRGTPLFQPDSKINAVVQGGSGKAYVVSYQMNTIDVMELNKRGEIRCKATHAVKNKLKRPVMITAMDSYYMHSSETMYILTASSTGEISLTVWKKGESSTNSIIFTSSSAPLQISFIASPKRKHSASLLFAFTMDGYIRCCSYDYSEPEAILLQEIEVQNVPGNKAKLNCVVDAKTGDTCLWWSCYKHIHSYLLHFECDGSYMLKNKMGFNTASIIDNLKISSTNAFSCSRSSETVHTMFLVEDTSKIVVCVRIRNECLFSRFSLNSKPSYVVLQMEDVMSTSEEAELDSTFRMYAAKRWSLSTYSCRIFHDGIEVQITKTRLKKISTNIADPSYLVVINLNERALRYGFISGSEGTQIVRICDKKREPISVEDDKALHEATTVLDES